RDDITTLANAVKQIRSVHTQLKERAALLKDDQSAKGLLTENKKLADKLDALEAKLHNPKAQVVYDILAQKGGAKLYSQYSALYEWLKDSDGPVTQGMREVYEGHVRELGRLEAEWNGLLDSDVRSLNELARSLDIPGVIRP